MQVLLSLMSYVGIFTVSCCIIANSAMSKGKTRVLCAILGALNGWLVLAFGANSILGESGSSLAMDSYGDCISVILSGYLQLPVFVSEVVSSLFNSAWADLAMGMGLVVFPACAGVAMSMKAIDHEDNILVMFFLMCLGAIMAFVLMLITAAIWGIFNYARSGDILEGILVVVIIAACFMSSGHVIRIVIIE